ncbi:helix-turn-helix domain-containing protein [Xenorhabdus bovienii]|uniref:Sugar fermentation stimulation protein B (Ner-like protein) (Modular protein) n=2 Tax=Xenorhabdus bovienii TaxID=40576 RepID=A0A077PP91_XENBV|nr:helix-turn-helix transcriptional regulator [Xenorhabdus bovienii]CDH00405.1 sugar fermentation stimulation protein B (Ner-like protein) (modular protein) [Xenorhabdus bovienii str. feltiae Moldova]CDH22417.1 sugar fermentation stimulation protein B (Ner-like protein) (modular protein) [Xenorhabdus bovienii str. kraussei Becker Underwood]
MINTHQDWHPAEIICALRKRGTTLAALSRESGLSSSTLANTLSRPWPKGEWIIATRLEMDPAEIWPSRYFDDYGNFIERKVRQPVADCQAADECQSVDEYQPVAEQYSDMNPNV